MGLHYLGGFSTNNVIELLGFTLSELILDQQQFRQIKPMIESAKTATNLQCKTTNITAISHSNCAKICIPSTI